MFWITMLKPVSNLFQANSEASQGIYKGSATADKTSLFVPDHVY